MSKAIHSALSEEERNEALQCLDKLDIEKSRYMRAAEKKLGTKKKIGKYEWSPTLEKAGRKVTYWKLRYYLLRGGDVNKSKLQQLQQQQHLEDTGSNSKRYI